MGINENFRIKLVTVLHRKQTNKNKRFPPLIRAENGFKGTRKNSSHVMPEGEGEVRGEERRERGAEGRAHSV